MNMIQQQNSPTDAAPPGAHTGSALLSSILIYSSFLTQYTSQCIVSGNCYFSRSTCIFVPSAKIWQICSFYSLMFCVHLKFIAVSNNYVIQKRYTVIPDLVIFS